MYDTLVTQTYTRLNEVLLFDFTSKSPAVRGVRLHSHTKMCKKAESSTRAQAPTHADATVDAFVFAVASMHVQKHAHSGLR